MKVEGFEDLEIWQLSRELTKWVYKVTRVGDFKTDYRFRDQIRASSGSVMDNIAEGFGRGGNKELINFLAIARGSIEETTSQLYRALDCNYITQEEFDSAMVLSRNIGKKITNLTSYLKSSDYKGIRYNSSNEDNIDYNSNSSNFVDITEN